MRRMWMVAGAAVSLMACDAIKQAESSQVMVGEVLSSPAEQVTTTAGTKTVPAQVVASVFLGTRDKTDLQKPPTPTTGAQVRIEFNGKTIPLAEKGNGNYLATSADQADLKYVAGTTYRFVAVTPSDTYAENVVAPEAEQIAEFHPTSGLPLLAVQPNTDLVLHRPPADGSRNMAFAAVVPVDQNGPHDPTFTDPPATFEGLINVILNPGDYEKDTVTIKGAQAWPTCSGSSYLISVTSVKKGSTEGTNLFLGSSALAGSADAAPAHCP